MSNVYDRVLITGGGGMLAQAFARVLHALGGAVASPSRADCDVVNHVAIERQLDSLSPTLVINCAAYTKVDQAETEAEQANAANGLGPMILATLCRRHGIPLVHFSTDYVFDGSLRRPLRPDDPVGPQSAYGRSKLIGEQSIQHHPPPRWLIIRIAWLYGPGGPNFVQTMLNVARAGKPLRVVDDQIGAPTFTHDLAEATLKLIDHDARGIWHVTNAGQTSWFGFAQAIFEEFGLTPDLRPTTSAEWKQLKPNSATRPAYSVLDIEPYARLTGTPMRHWRDALRDYHRVIENTPTS